MADVNVKTIETRLQLKYDTYANWTDDSKAGVGANLVLLKGEIGIVEIEAKRASDPTVQTPAPTVLFKVGDGEHKFSELNWASALAADVYAWAKAETVEFNSASKKVEFKTGDTVIHDVDLSFFASASDVTDHGTRLADIEAALGLEGGEGSGSVSAQLASIVQRLGVIQGADTVEGSIAKAEKDAIEAAKAYTDEVAGNYTEGVEGEDGYKAASGLRKEIAEAQAAAVTSANAYTDGEVATLNAEDSRLAGEITRVEGLVTAEATNRENGDKAITDLIGTGFEATETGTVAAKVKAAQDAADAAQADVDALTAADGLVTKNAADIAQLQSDLADEAEAREAADNALDVRLDKIETFFAGAYDENGKALNEALDTLVEIQDYLDGDGNAAGTLVDKVAKNASDIADLQATLADGGDFEKRVDDVEAKASANASAIESLQALTAGEFGEGVTIKDAIDAAAQLGQTGIDNAATAQAAAEAAQGEVDALEGVVSTLRGEYDVTKALATSNEAAISALDTRVGTAEGEIDAIQAIVSTGNDSNAKLREAIEALEAIVVDGDDNNVALGAEIDAIAAKVNDEDEGLEAAYEAATDAQSRVAAIEADYLKSTDVFVFNCGSSSTVTHTAPATQE